MEIKNSYVPKNIYLTDFTFYENIAFGLKKDEISKSKVIQAAKNAIFMILLITYQKNMKLMLEKEVLN